MSEWILTSEAVPQDSDSYLVCWDEGPAHEAFYSESSGKWLINSRPVSNPYCWMPLPNPPPRESSFEKWWNTPYKGPSWGGIKDMAKTAWDAAIAASKHDDFVP